MRPVRWWLRRVVPDTIFRDGGLLGLTAFLIALIVLNGCSSPPMASVKVDKHLPPGWVRYSYGALSVGAPRGWTIYRYVPLCPPAVGTTGVVEFTETTPEAASCAAPGTGTSRVIALGCLTGEAIGQFPIGSPSETTVDGGRLIRKSATQASLRGDGWEARFLLLQGFSPPSLGQEILSTVKPTGRSCR